MHHPSVYHTIAIFERLLRDVPPLVPERTLSDAKAAYEQMRHNYSLSLREVEAVLLEFGKKLWPYRRAFHEFYEVYEGKLGEQFLRAKMKGNTKKKYDEFRALGGTYRALHSGENVEFFSSNERQKLCVILVEVSQSIREHTAQSVQSVDREQYEKRIVEFHTILEDIETRLDTLRQMAEDESEHPELREDLLSQVEGFEHGLCLLGQHTSYEAVCSSVEHHEGRRTDRKKRQLYKQ